MAYYSITVSGEPVAAAAVETLCQVVAGTTKRVTLSRWGVSFNGADGTRTPVRVELMRFSDAGSSSAFVPVKMDSTADTGLATARTAFTAQPTAGDVLEVQYVTPAGGNVVEVFDLGERPVVPINGRLGIRVLANDAVNASAFMIFEE